MRKKGTDLFTINKSFFTLRARDLISTLLSKLLSKQLVAETFGLLCVPGLQFVYTDHPGWGEISAD